MKLNIAKKKAFIRAVMQDVPKVDYYEQMRKLVQEEARQQLPPAVMKIYDNLKFTKYVNIESVWLRPAEGESITVYVPSGRRDDKFTMRPDAQRKFDALGKADYEQTLARRELETKLTAIVIGCTTRKQLVSSLPEFEKYAPTVNEKTANLPAIANVVSDFVAAGWPKK